MQPQVILYKSRSQWFSKRPSGILLGESFLTTLVEIPDEARRLYLTLHPTPWNHRIKVRCLRRFIFIFDGQYLPTPVPFDAWLMQHIGRRQTQYLSIEWSNK